jgi:hypothetical protein
VVYRSAWLTHAYLDDWTPWRRLVGVRIAYYALRGSPNSCGVSPSVQVSGALDTLNKQEPL